MILVLDTNVVVSAQVFGGPPADFMAEALRNGHVLATCAEILAEIEDVFQRKHIVTIVEKYGVPSPSVLHYARMAAFYHPVSVPPTSRDPDDDVILGCAISAKADMIVTGDKDLLDLESFQEIPIVTVANALGRIRK